MKRIGKRCTLTWAARFSEIPRARDDGDARSRAEKDTCRWGDDGVRRQRDYLQVHVTVLDGRLDELR